MSIDWTEYFRHEQELRREQQPQQQQPPAPDKPPPPRAPEPEKRTDEPARIFGVTGEIRAAAYEHNGKLVVPVVALVEGVIRASNVPAPEYVPSHVLGCAVSSWAGRPVTFGHPKRNGTVCSANDPDIHDAHAIGTIYNPRVTDKKLLMEAWLDPVKAERVCGSGLLDRLRVGERIDVSIGAFVKTKPTTGEWGGKKYEAVWEALEPDHLAFVEKGACSGADGCGANRAAEHCISVEELARFEPPNPYVLVAASADELVAEFGEGYASGIAAMRGSK